ncbi:MAG: SPOR domain-containing protein [Bacteroidota bacterium]|nr:SPOR domain-containing protein [Bacteroidota bacterium]
MNLERYIGELLFEHDCVIIPGFGGFIGNYSPARIHPTQHTFYPPSKTLLFNINLVQNDGLLANRISMCDKISFLDALRKISGTVGLWNRELNEGKTVALSGVGRFFKDKEGNLQFEQDREINFLPGSFGLSPFMSPAIQQAGLRKKAGKKINRYINAPVSERVVIPKVLKWAAVLVLPLGIATALSVVNFDKIQDLSTSYSGIVIPSSRMEFRKVLPARTSNIFIQRPPASSPVPVIKSNPSSVPPPKSESTKTHYPVAIIAGAFRVHENAEKLVAGLRTKGFDASILDTTKNGLFRVSIQTFPSMGKAIEQLAAIKRQGYPSAWILSK